MFTKLTSLRRTLLLTIASSVASPAAVHAVGTAAGTNITNTATVNYSLGGTPTTITSNTTTLAVAELINVTIALQSPTVSVAAGGSNKALLFLVTNTGNGGEIFALAGDSVLVGDDFDPTPAAPFIYFDTDSSGDLSPADTPYVAGGNDPFIAADGSVAVLLVNNIPPGLPDGEYGRSELTATANTGTGAPGTVMPGQGPGGVDAVIGTSGGVAAVFGQYLVGDILLSAVKSQAVLDPFGGSQPIPGAAITYQIVVTAAGSGVALGAAFSDPIPASTTYVAGSLRLNGATLTDSVDSDAGSFTLGPARVAVSLGDLSTAAGPQTIDFRVTIN
ncbi:MAG TPA: hypothetical protein VNP02_03545 [Gammaproteobacteria bacterium]|nr:hypothetical protein [Gammaproteobacteria bacterium]